MFTCFSLYTTIAVDYDFSLHELQHCMIELVELEAY